MITSFLAFKVNFFVTLNNSVSITIEFRYTRAHTLTISVTMCIRSKSIFAAT